MSALNHKENLELARFNMVAQQIAPWNLFDGKVLAAMQQVPREAFVPAAFANLAFSDCELPLNATESMMFPRVEARMLQSLAINAEDQILEIGTGSGFVTALLAHLGSHVTSVEIDAALSTSAAEKLQAHTRGNYTLAIGDAAEGWEATRQFDVIALTGSLPLLPEAYKQQLSVGGRLFVVTGASPVMQASVITRTDHHRWQSEALFETVLTPLHHRQRQSNRFIL
ncbi:MAG: protein-L-isoaspartate O-methyltransferase [Gammaproteobacteria bacterium]|nr:protein-L-isoaspartate O-methyltransferase [Gammaproteobacteria bacterium]